MDEQSTINGIAPEPQKPDEKEESSKGGSKNVLIAVSVIAVVALVLAGFFFVNYKNAQKASEDLAKKSQETLDKATKEVETAAQRIAKEQAEKEAKAKALIAEQQKLIDEANKKASESAQSKVETCKVLQKTMPPKSAVSYRSDNWEKDIYRFYKDLEAKQKTYEQDSDEWDNIGLQKRVTEPYKDNFMAQCGDLYDIESGKLSTSAPVATPTSKSKTDAKPSPSPAQ